MVLNYQFKDVVILSQLFLNCDEVLAAVKQILNSSSLSDQSCLKLSFFLVKQRYLILQSLRCQTSYLSSLLPHHTPGIEIMVGYQLKPTKKNNQPEDFEIFLFSKIYYILFYLTSLHSIIAYEIYFLNFYY